MRVAGIVAEYNPFHNGHAHHVAATREKGKCDYVIAVMSGAFTQRGEPALLDKWARAKMALLGGVDLVLELPALFAVRPAEDFAWGGVSLLGALNTVDVLSFGCETDDLPLLTRMADALAEEPPSLKEGLRARLAAGQTHARARGEALSAYLGVPPEAVNAPNTTLALSYLKANRRLDTPMEILPVKRAGEGHHSGVISPLASAGAIRAALAKGEPLEKAMPAASFEILSALWPAQSPSIKALDDLLLYRLRGLTDNQAQSLEGAGEGLGLRVKKAARDAISRAELIERVKCKRYTYARISRVLAAALLGIDDSICARFESGAPYARVLGFRDKARPLLRALNSNADIPIIADPTLVKDDACFEIERRATDLWGLLTKDERLRRAGRDLTEKPVIVMDYTANPTTGALPTA